MQKLLSARAHALVQNGLDLLFPPRCAGCGRDGHLLCPDCLRTMQPLAAPFCQRYGVPLAHSTACQHAPFHLHQLCSVNIYRGALRRAIHALKYQGQRRLAEPLGLLLAEAFVFYGIRADAIVPLPLHPQRQQQRGYNQAILLARVCAARLKVPCLEDIVIRQRATREQVGLNAQERQQNVYGAFALTPGAKTRLFPCHTVVLIDDVSTTGATLESCAAPLYAAGVPEVCGFVLASPDKLIQDISKGVL